MRFICFAENTDEVPYRIPQAVAEKFTCITPHIFIYGVRSLILDCPCHFPFTLRTGKPLDPETCRFHVTLHLALRAIGHQDSTGLQRFKHALEHLLRPQLRLHARGKSIKVYKIELLT